MVLLRAVDVAGDPVTETRLADARPTEAQLLVPGVFASIFLPEDAPTELRASSPTTNRTLPATKQHLLEPRASKACRLARTTSIFDAKSVNLGRALATLHTRIAMTCGHSRFGS